MIRKQTLAEWFTNYQLHSIGKRHFHLPVLQDIDVTAIAHHYEGKSAPWTTITMQVICAAARAYPPMNRMIFHTLAGVRVVEPPYIALNIPVLLRNVEPEYLSATSVLDADLKTVQKLHEEIRVAASKHPSQLPVGKLIFKKENTFFNRIKLQLLHFLVYSSPRLFLKYKGGAMSFSSLLLFNRPSLSIRPVSYGPTGLTFCALSVVKSSDGQSILKLGVGADHFALSGAEGARALSEVARQFGLWNPLHSDPHEATHSTSSLPTSTPPHSPL